MGDDPAAGLQLGQELRAELAVEVGAEVERDHGGLAEIRLEEILLEEGRSYYAMVDAGSRLAISDLPFKDAKELWDASDNLDQACESCHRSYWYPGETRAYYTRLDRRLREHVDNLPPSASTPKPKK